MSRCGCAATPKQAAAETSCLSKRNSPCNDWVSSQGGIRLGIWIGASRPFSLIARLGAQCYRRDLGQSPCDVEADRETDHCHSRVEEMLLQTLLLM